MEPSRPHNAGPNRPKYVMRAPTIPRMGFSLTRTKSAVKERLKRQSSAQRASENGVANDPQQFEDASDDDGAEVAPIVNVDDFGCASSLSDLEAERQDRGDAAYFQDANSNVSSQPDTVVAEHNTEEACVYQETAFTPGTADLEHDREKIAQPPENALNDSNIEENERDCDTTKKDCDRERGNVSEHENLAAKAVTSPGMMAEDTKQESLPNGEAHFQSKENTHTIQKNGAHGIALTTNEEAESTTLSTSPKQVGEMAHDIQESLIGLDPPVSMEVDTELTGNVDELQAKSHAVKRGGWGTRNVATQSLWMVASNFLTILSYVVQIMLFPVRRLSRATRGRRLNIAQPSITSEHIQGSEKDKAESKDSVKKFSSAPRAEETRVENWTDVKATSPVSDVDNSAVTSDASESSGQERLHSKEAASAKDACEITSTSAVSGNGDAALQTSPGDEAAEDDMYDDLLTALTSTVPENRGADIPMNPQKVPHQSADRSPASTAGSESDVTVPLLRRSISKRIQRLGSKLSRSESQDGDGWAQVPSRKDIKDMKSSVLPASNNPAMQMPNRVGREPAIGAQSKHTGSVSDLESTIGEPDTSPPQEGQIYVTSKDSNVLSNTSDLIMRDVESLRDTEPIPESEAAEQKPAVHENRDSETMTREFSGKRADTSRKSETSSTGEVTDQDRSMQETELSLKDCSADGPDENGQFQDRVRDDEFPKKSSTRLGIFPAKTNVGGLRDIKNDAKSALRSLGVSRRTGEDTRFASARSARKTMSLLADILTNDMGAVCSVRKNGALRMAVKKEVAGPRTMRIRVQIERLDDFSCNVNFSKERGDKTESGMFVSFVNDAHEAFISRTTSGKRTPGY